MAAYECLFFKLCGIFLRGLGYFLKHERNSLSVCSVNLVAPVLMNLSVKARASHWSKSMDANDWFEQCFSSPLSANFWLNHSSSSWVWLFCGFEGVWGWFGCCVVAQFR